MKRLLSIQIYTDLGQSDLHLTALCNICIHLIARKIDVFCSLRDAIILIKSFSFSQMTHKAYEAEMDPIHNYCVTHSSPIEADEKELMQVRCCFLQRYWRVWS